MRLGRRVVLVHLFASLVILILVLVLVRVASNVLPVPLVLLHLLQLALELLKHAGPTELADAFQLRLVQLILSRLEGGASAWDPRKGRDERAGHGCCCVEIDPLTEILQHGNLAGKISDRDNGHVEYYVSFVFYQYVIASMCFDQRAIAL